MPDDLWSDADIIDIYTRRQAIEDGVLVQLSGPGYQGGQWIPAMVAEAGFRYPVGMTAMAFYSCVSPLEGDDEKLAPCQDTKGRLWDVLWMLKAAIRRIQAPLAILHFSLRVVPNVPANYSKPKRRRPSARGCLHCDRACRVRACTHAPRLSAESRACKRAPYDISVLRNRNYCGTKWAETRYSTSAGKSLRIWKSNG